MATKKHSRGKENSYPKKLSKNEIKSTSFQSNQSTTSSTNRKGSQARVVVKYDVGFKNALFVRGKGANLSWDKGIPLKNVNKDEWIWEPDASFSDCEFKILINDTNYEAGENHRLRKGMKIQFTPNFNC